MENFKDKKNDDILEKLVHINRITKVVKGGRRFGFAALVVVGNQKGSVGIGQGKSKQVPDAIKKATEVAKRNINVNVISPGFISTSMTDNLSSDLKNSYLSRIPMSRFGKPEDIANLVYFLSSDQSSYITGQNFHINGGMLMV